MKKFFTIMLMAYYSLGMIFLPSGNFEFVSHLPEMYAQCKDEDPDMNIPDFVFVHFLNLEDIIAPFEHKEENEKPHQPYAQAPCFNQVLITVANPIMWHSKENFIPFVAKLLYPLQDDSFIPHSYLPGLFRPPIIS